MNRVKGKIALVTGAGLGLGRAAALMLAREGARVIGATMRQAPSGNGGAAGVPNTPAPKRTRHDATPNGRRSKHEPGLVRW